MDRPGFKPRAFFFSNYPTMSEWEREDLWLNSHFSWTCEVSWRNSPLENKFCLGNKGASLEQNNENHLIITRLIMGSNLQTLSPSPVQKLSFICIRKHIWECCLVIFLLKITPLTFNRRINKGTRTLDNRENKWTTYRYRQHPIYKKNKAKIKRKTYIIGRQDFKMSNVNPK